MEKLYQARLIANIPFVISSGCRCIDHNTRVKGSTMSDHLCDVITRNVGGQLTEELVVTTGVDIIASNGVSRFRIVKALLEVGIDRIIFYKNSNHIHAGVSLRNVGDQMLMM
jgi:CRP-like cAMP-binding protein